MAATGKALENSFDEIKTILISQPKPQRSPYFKLEEKFDLRIDWRPFIHVELLPNREFRRQRIKIEDYSALVFTSKNAIENFFLTCEEMRVKMSAETKYFCLTEAVANYLQKFIIYRKRKVFVGNRKIEDLSPYFEKHKAKEKFLVPVSNLRSRTVVGYLKNLELDFQEAQMYRTVSSDLSDLAEVTYDALVFFSPLGIQSLYDNFPEFKQNKTRLAVYGASTLKATEEKGLVANISAPRPGIPSMSMALEKYLKISQKK